jgi:MOSC domain-containing protein YiiM
VRDGVVVAVSADAQHRFSKQPRPSVRLLQGLGVEGDAHLGATVQHRSRVARDPSQPNLRQVHLIHVELHDELRAAGHVVEPGQLGENITTRGVDLLGLPTGTRLHVGPDVVIELTGLRNPCAQIDAFQAGLLRQVLVHDDAGNPVRKAGVMGVVVRGGGVRAGDRIVVALPAAPHAPLECV